MEFEKAAEAFRRKELELDFATIKIAQCSETEPVTYTGPGYFRQDAGGKLEVKCYATTTPQMGIAAFNRQMRSSSGSLYSEEDYYRTSAIDHAGHEWEASPSLLGSSISFVTDASVMILTPRSLVRRLGWKGSASRLRLEFFGQRERNWKALFGAHDIEYADGQQLGLTIERGADEAVIVTASAPGSLPPALEMRLVEALQFVLCLDLHVDVSDIAGDGKRTGELRSAGARQSRINPYPPLNTRSPGNTAAVITLFQHYLRYALGAQITDAWHPCSAHLAHARQASANSLEAWEVGLSVAVEGIANLIPADPPPETVDYRELRKELTAWLGEHGYPESLVNRIGGMLGGLEMVRPKDRMMGLVGCGAASKDDLAAWVRVRNTAVHTRQVTSSDLEDSELQRRFDQLHRVYRLMHGMVFHLIGYSGPYSNYAERGFPEAVFPLSAEGVVTFAAARHGPRAGKATRPLLRGGRRPMLDRCTGVQDHAMEPDQLVDARPVVFEQVTRQLDQV